MFSLSHACFVLILILYFYVAVTGSPLRCASHTRPDLPHGVSAALRDRQDLPHSTTKDALFLTLGQGRRPGSFTPAAPLSSGPVEGTAVLQVRTPAAPLSASSLPAATSQRPPCRGTPRAPPTNRHQALGTHSPFLPFIVAEVSLCSRHKHQTTHHQLRRSSFRPVSRESVMRHALGLYNRSVYVSQCTLFRPSFPVKNKCPPPFFFFASFSFPSRGFID